MGHTLMSLQREQREGTVSPQWRPSTRLGGVCDSVALAHQSGLAPTPQTYVWPRVRLGWSGGQAVGLTSTLAPALPGPRDPWGMRDDGCSSGEDAGP